MLNIVPVTVPEVLLHTAAHCDDSTMPASVGFGGNHRKNVVEALHGEPPTGVFAPRMPIAGVSGSRARGTKKRPFLVDLD